VHILFFFVFISDVLFWFAVDRGRRGCRGRHAPGGLVDAALWDPDLLPQISSCDKMTLLSLSPEGLPLALDFTELLRLSCPPEVLVVLPLVGLFLCILTPHGLWLKPHHRRSTGYPRRVEDPSASASTGRDQLLDEVGLPLFPLASSSSSHVWKDTMSSSCFRYIIPECLPRTGQNLLYFAFVCRLLMHYLLYPVLPSFFEPVRGAHSFN